VRPLCKHQVQAEWTEVDTQARNQVAVVNRDVNETFSFESRDRDDFRDVTHGALCQAYGFQVQTAIIMLCFVHLLSKQRFSSDNSFTGTFVKFRSIKLGNCSLLLVQRVLVVLGTDVLKSLKYLLAKVSLVCRIEDSRLYSL